MLSATVAVVTARRHGNNAPQRGVCLGVEFGVRSGVREYVQVYVRLSAACVRMSSESVRSRAVQSYEEDGLLEAWLQ